MSILNNDFLTSNTFSNNAILTAHLPYRTTVFCPSHVRTRNLLNPSQSQPNVSQLYSKRVRERWPTTEKIPKAKIEINKWIIDWRVPICFYMFIITIRRPEQRFWAIIIIFYYFFFSPKPMSGLCSYAFGYSLLRWISREIYLHLAGGKLNCAITSCCLFMI